MRKSLTTLAGAFIALLGTMSATAVAADCPNEAIRVAQHITGLEGCRAYEVVSPADKNGVDLITVSSTDPSSPDGKRISYASLGSFADPIGASANSHYLASRDEAGWASRAIDPPHPGAVILFTKIPWFSEDLSKAILVANEAPPLLPAGPTPGMLNLYLRDFATGSHTLLDPPAGGSPFGFPLQTNFEAATPDGSHVVFESEQTLTADAPPNPPDKGPGEFTMKTYEYDAEEQELRFVGLLPDGTPAPGGSIAGRGDGFQNPNVLSVDGSRIIFTEPDTSLPGQQARGRIYMREDGVDTTWLSRSEASTPEPTPLPAEFRGASADGSRVFFTTDEQLTDSDTNPTAEGQKGDLYAYDATRPDSSPDNLSVLSVDAEPADGTGVVLGVLGTSADGGRVYFAHQSQLVAGAPIQPAGTPPAYLYLWEEGQLHFIAPLSPADKHTFGAESIFSTSPDDARIDPSGSKLLFASSLPLQPEAKAFAEIYLYDAETEELRCASCPPPGVTAAGDARIASIDEDAGVVNATQYKSRAVSANGKLVFFDTPDPLVAADTNRARDVYAYEVDTEAAHLISSGRGAEESLFADASADGGDVFFYTRNRLSGRDTDQNIDLYDARVNGGFPEPVASDVGGCVADDCQGSPGALPPPPMAGSGLVTGPATGGRRNSPKPKRHCKRAKRRSCRHGQKTPKPSRKEAHR